jgi:hypothetical protein
MNDEANSSLLPSPRLPRYARNDKFFGFALIIFIFCHLTSFAQTTPYTDQVFTPAIKTVEFYNTKKEQSFPLIELNSNQQLLLAFDDLRGSSRNFYYTIEHCDENWNPTNIAQSEYLQGFNEDQIRDYNYSSSTVQKYTHYELKYPNQYLAAPKISGNYVLKIYEDGDKSRMAIIRRFYVLDSKVSMMAEVVPSSDISLRQTNQKINFQVDCGNLRVQNPNYDIKAMIMQNRRPETAVMNTQPASIQGNRLIYNDIATNDFPGLNEFRHFDTRTLKFNSDRVGHIYKDTANSVVLLTDFTMNQPNYAFYYDNDGKFFPGNSDGSDPRIDADYAHMYFTLASTKSQDEGSVYIVGLFNNYQLDDSNKLYYDPADRHFHIQMLIKQGVYDYEYVWLPKGAQKPDDAAFSGSHYETENEYQILVYYHPAGTRWTELVGYRPLNTTPKR